MGNQMFCRPQTFVPCANMDGRMLFVRYVMYPHINPMGTIARDSNIAALTVGNCPTRVGTCISAQTTDATIHPMPLLENIAPNLVWTMNLQNSSESAASMKPSNNAPHIPPVSAMMSLIVNPLGATRSAVI